VYYFKHSLHFLYFISAILFGLSNFSCSRIKRKGHEVVDKTKNKISEKRDAVVDKLIPTFNSYTPDTKANKKRFQEFFGFTPTPDIKDIYCFDDQIGIDSKFVFSFRCDSSTKNRITKHLNLKELNQPDNFSRGFWQSFTWWDSAKIVTLTPYHIKLEHELHKYLWYDEKKQTVYYIQFDM